MWITWNFLSAAANKFSNVLKPLYIILMPHFIPQNKARTPSQGGTLCTVPYRALSFTHRPAQAPAGKVTPPHLKGMLTDGSCSAWGSLRRAGRSILPQEHRADLCAGGVPQLPNSHELETTMLAPTSSRLTDDITPPGTVTQRAAWWANPHQLFITLWQKMLPPRRHLLPTPVLKTTLKPDAITLERNERALLCEHYYCTIKLDTYTRREFSWGKNTKFSGQNSHSMYKIKHLTADWRTQAMIPNRISTLNKDFFHTAEQDTSRKIQIQAGHKYCNSKNQERAQNNSGHTV